MLVTVVTVLYGHGHAADQARYRQAGRQAGQVASQLASQPAVVLEEVRGVECYKGLAPHVLYESRVTYTTHHTSENSDRQSEDKLILVQKSQEKKCTTLIQ